MLHKPLDGIKVLELAGLAPVPFAGMVLADFGADVVRLDPIQSEFNPDPLSRNKRSISLSLKTNSGLSAVKKLLTPFPQTPSKWTADILLDPFRPGVMERLGLIPQELIAANPRLIIARLTGFKRTGPYAQMAGHDINYMALSGVLDMIGRKDEKPYAPLNVVADFGGGGLMNVVGILLALIERNRSGKGQIVETDMVTGTRYLSSFNMMLSRPSAKSPYFSRTRGENMLDSGAPFYEVYKTKDGQHMSVGALEQQFYAIFLKILLANSPTSIHPSPLPTPALQNDRTTWPTLFKFFESAFLQKTREEWSNIFMGSDACVVPVLNHQEVDAEGELVQSEGKGERTDGSTPEPRPVLSRTPAHKVAGTGYDHFGGYYLKPGQHTIQILQNAGFSRPEIENLLAEKVVIARNRDSKL